MKKSCLLFVVCCLLFVVLGCDNSGGLPAGSNPALPAGSITGFTFTENHSLHLGSLNVQTGGTVGFFGNVGGATSPYAFSLVPGEGAGDNNLFAIGIANLVVNIPAPLYALTESRQYFVRVRVADAEGESFDKAITFFVAPTPVDVDG